MARFDKLERAPAERVLKDGSILRIEFINPLPSKKRTPSSVARHEAHHAIVALLEKNVSVIELSVIPEGDSSGHVKLTGYSAASFAAPHAMGDDGTSYDLSVIEEVGDDLGSAMATARSYLSNRHRMVQAVGTLADEHGVLTGAEIDEIRRRVEEGEGIKITLLKPKENKRVEKTLKVDSAADITAADLLQKPEVEDVLRQAREPAPGQAHTSHKGQPSRGYVPLPSKTS